MSRGSCQEELLTWRGQGKQVHVVGLTAPWEIYCDGTVMPNFCCPAVGHRERADLSSALLCLRQPCTSCSTSTVCPRAASCWKRWMPESGVAAAVWIPARQDVMKLLP